MEKKNSQLTLFFKGEQIEGTQYGPDSFYIPKFMQKYLKLNPDVKEFFFFSIFRFF